jgi:hypothetical protein
MLNTNQKAKPKQNKKPKQNEGKIANKKLKKTRIGGGETTPQQLKIELETMLTRLEEGFGDILKNTNNNQLLIDAIQKYKNTEYQKQSKDAIIEAVRDGLVLLLKKYTSSTEQDEEASHEEIVPDKNTLSTDEKETSDEEIVLLLGENTTKPDASTGYEKFKSLVEVFTENIKLPPPSNYKETQESKTFKEHIYRIYTDGIVLLTISKTRSPVANVYKTDKNMIEYKTLDTVADFLTKSENCLIIVNLTETNDNYVYDCMLQILSKLVNILLASDNLQKYINRYLNNEDASPVSSEKQEIKKETVLNELIQAIYNNLKYETIDKYTIEKHRVLLRSLIFIRYGVDKDIKEEKFQTVKEAYIKQFETIAQLADELSNFEYTQIVDTNILEQPSYFPLNCMSNSMIESFQHILNAMSSSSNSISEDNKNILIKLSVGLLTSDCKRTINNIIETKSYLLSAPLIMSEYIKRNYISKIKGKHNNGISIKDIRSVEICLIEFRNEIAAIIRTVDDVNTKNALSKIYTDLKDNITKKYKNIFRESLVDNIEEYSKQLTKNGTV